jgi:arsenite methyltransferase
MSEPADATPRLRLTPYRFAPEDRAPPLRGLHDDYEAGLLEGLPDGFVAGSLGFGGAPRALDVRPGMWVLDVGCGGGLDLALARRAAGGGGGVAGIDSSPDVIEGARLGLAGRDEGAVELRVGLAEALPWPDDRFDRVLMNCSLSLFADPPRALAEAARVARPGGRLAVLDVAVDRDLDPTLRRALSGFGSGVAGALPMEELRQRIQVAGWQIVACGERRWTAEDLWASAVRAGAGPQHESALTPLLQRLAGRLGRVTAIADLP